LVAESGLGGEAVSLSVNGPDRRTAMLRLAELISQQS
jgi:phosphotransferase system HPr-like phosphotransfer protein